MNKSPLLGLFCHLVAGVGISGFTIAVVADTVQVFDQADVVSAGAAAVFCTLAGVIGAVLHTDK